MSVTVKMVVFWDVAPYSLVKINVTELLTASITAQMMEVVSTPETSFSFSKTTVVKHSRTQPSSVEHFCNM
jgi:hypothetical protein